MLSESVPSIRETLRVTKRVLRSIEFDLLVGPSDKVNESSDNEARFESQNVLISFKFYPTSISFEFSTFDFALFKLYSSGYKTTSQ